MVVELQSNEDDITEFINCIADTVNMVNDDGVGGGYGCGVNDGR